VRSDPSALRYVALSPDAKDMAENIYRALWAWLVCVLVTVVVSYMTKPTPVAQLEGLVYGVSPLPKEHDDHWYQRPIVWAGAVTALFIILNVVFW
jgi:SSS family solute:Na+ symporter